VRADPWAVKRIVENLLSNAVKFSNPDEMVTVSLMQDGNQIAVAVRDNGIGMPPEVVSRLGELFFQAESRGSKKFEGMGARLALSFGRHSPGRMRRYPPLLVAAPRPFDRRWRRTLGEILQHALRNWSWRSRSRTSLDSDAFAVAVSVAASQAMGDR
jgi:hypothetical protein